MTSTVIHKHKSSLSSRTHIPFEGDHVVISQTVNRKGNLLYGTWWLNRNSARHLRAFYGMSVKQANAVIQARKNGECAICKKQVKILDVDHNHVTGELRGLICRKCNLIIGMIETPKKILPIVNYLRHPPGVILS